MILQSEATYEDIRKAWSSREIGEEVIVQAPDFNVEAREEAFRLGIILQIIPWSDPCDYYDEENEILEPDFVVAPWKGEFSDY